MKEQRRRDVVRQVADQAQVVADAREIERQCIARMNRHALRVHAVSEPGNQVAIDLDDMQMIEPGQQGFGQAPPAPGRSRPRGRVRCGSMAETMAAMMPPIDQKILAEALARDMALHGRLPFWRPCVPLRPAPRTGFRIGTTAAGQFECRAVIDRGTNDRQAERDIDAMAESRVLERGQPLVVVHRQHRIALGQHGRREHGVGRLRPEQSHALGTQPVEYRHDDLDLLAPEVAPFAGMRIEAGNQDARRGYPVFLPAYQHAGCAACVPAGRLRHRRRHVLQRQVGRRQRDAQRARPSSGEHHDDQRRARPLGKVFGMTGEMAYRHR